MNEDRRGWIRKIALPDGKEILFLFTKQGFMRGGHFHSAEQKTFLLSGSVQWVMKNESFEWTVVQWEGETVDIPKGQAHLAEYLKDSLSIEWIEGQNGSTNIPSMRKRVEERMHG